MNNPILLLGGGGHSGVLIETIQLLSLDILGIIDPNLKKGTLVDNNIPILGGDSIISSYSPDDVLLVNAVGPSPREKVREMITKKYMDIGYKFLTVIHPDAQVSNKSIISEGAQIMAGSVIQANTRIGIDSVINTGAVIDHDSVIGDHCHVAPGAIICGGVTAGDGSFFGAGSIVLENISIGEYSLLAAGITLRKNLQANEVFYGK